MNGTKRIGVGWRDSGGLEVGMVFEVVGICAVDEGADDTEA